MSSQNLTLTALKQNEGNTLREISKTLIKDLSTLSPGLIQSTEIELHTIILSKLSELFLGFETVEKTLKSSISTSKAKRKYEKSKTLKTRKLSSQNIKQKHSLLKSRKTSWKKQEKKLTAKILSYQNLWNDNLQSFLKISKKSQDISKNLESQASRLREEALETNFAQNKPFHSKKLSTDSAEFEICMAEIEKNRCARAENPFEISLEKSFGGWKSELESDLENSYLVSQEDIKHAVEVLEKAKLLDRKNISKLAGIYEVLSVNDYENIQEVLEQVDKRMLLGSGKPPLYLKDEVLVDESDVLSCKILKKQGTNLKCSQINESKNNKKIRKDLDCSNLNNFTVSGNLQRILKELSLCKEDLENEEFFRIESQVTECTIHSKRINEFLGQDSSCSFSLNF